MMPRIVERMATIVTVWHVACVAIAAIFVGVIVGVSWSEGKFFFYWFALPFGVAPWLGKQLLRSPLLFGLSFIWMDSAMATLFSAAAGLSLADGRFNFFNVFGPVAELLIVFGPFVLAIIIGYFLNRGADTVTKRT